jgi:hypothetical protein
MQERNSNLLTSQQSFVFRSSFVHFPGCWQRAQACMLRGAASVQAPSCSHTKTSRQHTACSNLNMRTSAVPQCRPSFQLALANLKRVSARSVPSKARTTQTANESASRISGNIPNPALAPRDWPATVFVSGGPANPSKISWNGPVPPFPHRHVWGACSSDRPLYSFRDQFRDRAHAQPQNAHSNGAMPRLI